MANTEKIQYLTPAEQKQLLRNVAHNEKHTLIILLMLDCGLRVTEVASLQLKYFDFKKRQVSLPSLKKRSSKPIYRDIPMTERVIDALSNYIVTLTATNPDAWCFPTNSKTGHISRIRIWRMVKKHSQFDNSPHDLRHSFASTLADKGTDLVVIKDLLGHKSVKTTEIYVHAAQNKKVAAIKSLQRQTIWSRLRSRFTKQRDIFLPIDPKQIRGRHVGRTKEMAQINDLYHKGINTIVFGTQGVGKTHLLNRIHGENILKLDDFKAVKTTLGALLLKLYNGDKNKIIDLLTKQTDINKVVTKQSIPQLIELLHAATKSQEYTIIIDDLTYVTTAGVSALEKLGKHFHIVAAARQLKFSQGSFLTNFERVDLKPLTRTQSLDLIKSLSRPFHSRISDKEAFKNHIYEQSNGNPQYITELIHRFSKESHINFGKISQIRHTTALHEIDFSIPIALGLSSLMVLRYLGNEFDTDQDAFRLIGGAFLIFALYGRSIFSYGKRKFV